MNRDIDEPHPPEETAAAAPECEFSDFTSHVLLVYNLLHTSFLSLDDLVAANCMDSSMEDAIMEDYSTLVFDRREQEQPHNPYDQELREFTSIELGDVDMLRRSLQFPLRHVPGDENSRGRRRYGSRSHKQQFFLPACSFLRMGPISPLFPLISQLSEEDLPAAQQGRHLVDHRVKIIFAVLDPVEIAELFQSRRQLLRPFKPFHHNRNDILVSLKCVMQFQIQPVLLIGAALQRTRREDDDHIPALVHHSEEFFIELA